VILESLTPATKTLQMRKAITKNGEDDENGD